MPTTFQGIIDEKEREMRRELSDLEWKIRYANKQIDEWTAKRDTDRRWYYENLKYFNERYPPKKEEEVSK